VYLNNMSGKGGSAMGSEIGSVRILKKKQKGGSKEKKLKSSQSHKMNPGRKVRGGVGFDHTPSLLEEVK